MYKIRQNEGVWKDVIWKRTKEREKDRRSFVQMAKRSLLLAQQLEKKEQDRKEQQVKPFYENCEMI